MFRKPAQIFTISIIIIIALIVFHQLGWLKSAEGIALRGLSPIGGFFYKVGKRTADFFGLIGSIRDLERQNLELQEKVNQLIVENAKLKEVERENELLRKQLDFVKSSEHKLLSAFIVAFDPSGLFQLITINRGEKDGVRQGMPVVVSGGILVGKVKETTSTTSQVLLITDSSSSISGLIQESQATGVVKGEMKLGLVMDMIPQDAEVKNGDRVLTSSLGGEFPEGLVIGQVEEVQRREGELFQKARIKPACDFRELEIVSVILK